MEVFFKSKGPFVFVIAGTRSVGVLYCSTAFSESPNPEERIKSVSRPRISDVKKLQLSCAEERTFEKIGPPQLRFWIVEDASSFPTESSTPLMNWTDSGAENLRAISSASLITTGRGV